MLHCVTLCDLLLHSVTLCDIVSQKFRKNPCHMSQIRGETLYKKKCKNFYIIDFAKISDM